MQIKPFLRRAQAVPTLLGALECRCLISFLPPLALSAFGCPTKIMYFAFVFKFSIFSFAFVFKSL